LDGVLPALIAGTAPRRPQDAASASYFGGRRPEDGTIDWKRDAPSIHNLVRAVAPPYPGAFSTLAVLSLELAGMPCDATALVARFGAAPVPLGTTAAAGHGHV